MPYLFLCLAKIVIFVLKIMKINCPELASESLFTAGMNTDLSLEGEVQSSCLEQQLPLHCHYRWGRDCQSVYEALILPLPPTKCRGCKHVPPHPTERLDLTTNACIAWCGIYDRKLNMVWAISRWSGNVRGFLPESFIRNLSDFFLDDGGTIHPSIG